VAGGAAFAIVAGATCAITDEHTVELGAAQVELADVASLDCIASSYRDQTGRMQIASLSGEREITRAALAALIRRRVPALSAVDPGGNPNALLRLRPPRAEPAPASINCYIARRALGAGEAITAADVEPAPCGAEAPSRRVRYERRDGVVRAAAGIAAGDQLGRMTAPAASITEAGEPLTLSVAVGPVVIERSVEAVQTSTGGAIFVRDPDGHVFSAPLAVESAP
jgi:hypothetical protein